VEAETYALIKKNIKSLFEIDLTYYKDEQMKRRLDSWLVRSGTPTWADYFKRVRTDDKELSRFRDYLTINVSAFFRDPERWQALRQTIVPDLLKNNRRLRVWSAGCSIGPEPYTLAILLDEMTPGQRHALLATDLDRGALTKAKARGPFTAEDIQNVTAAQRAKHFDPGGPPHFVTDALSKRVDFRELNLLTDAFDSHFDLIVCRNVVIYFTDAAKQDLYRKFCNALRPGGVLFVGGTEVISRAPDLGFRSVGISFYQRVA
jgi:chemotaxis protein methyltransferase CheR